jgi:hypothetical protein
MAGPQTQIDADFFNLIHRVVGKRKMEEEAERRAHRREPFKSWQRVAPWDGLGCPDPSEFVEVTCHDLTRSGFSFLISHRPGFRQLLAEFGQPPEVIRVAAEVVRCTDVLVDADGQVVQLGGIRYDAAGGGTGTPMVLVGCQFTQRLSGPADGAT